MFMLIYVVEFLEDCIDNFDCTFKNTTHTKKASVRCDVSTKHPHLVIERCKAPPPCIFYYRVQLSQPRDLNLGKTKTCNRGEGMTGRQDIIIKVIQL